MEAKREKQVSHGDDPIVQHTFAMAMYSMIPDIMLATAIMLLPDTL